MQRAAPAVAGELDRRSLAGERQRGRRPRAVTPGHHHDDLEHAPAPGRWRTPVDRAGPPRAAGSARGAGGSPGRGGRLGRSARATPPAGRWWAPARRHRRSAGRVAVVDDRRGAGSTETSVRRRAGPSRAPGGGSVGVGLGHRRGHRRASGSAAGRPLAAGRRSSPARRRRRRRPRGHAGHGARRRVRRRPGRGPGRPGQSRPPLRATPPAAEPTYAAAAPPSSTGARMPARLELTSVSSR